jgi:hypothetical protein
LQRLLCRQGKCSAFQTQTTSTCYEYYPTSLTSFLWIVLLMILAVFG